METRSTTSVGIRFAILSSANLGAAALGFVITLFVARSFGPAGLGMSTLALSVAGFGLTATIFGTDLHAVRTAAALPELMAHHVKVVTALRLMLAGFSYAMLILVGMLTPAFRDIVPLIALFGLSVFTVPIGPEWVPQALHRTGVTALANLSLQIVYLAFLLIGWFLHASLLSVAAAKIGADLVVAIGFRRWVGRTMRPDSDRLRWNELVALAKSSWPICGTQILRTFALSSDLILLGVFLTRADLGHYSAASKLFYVMMAFATAYFVILLPRFAESAVRPDPALSDELRASLRRTVPIALAGLAILTLLARPILVLMFGATFGVAAPSLAILGAATVISLASRHYRQVLLARGLQMHDLKFNVVGAITHIGAKLALIPTCGIVGAAIGTLIGEVAILWLQRRAAIIELARGTVKCENVGL